MAVYTGLRWGELAALRKRDVELEPEARITVHRSWESDKTKSGRARVVPVAAECLPFLRAAIGRSPSDFVFPGPKGKQRSRKSNLSKRVRAAMARAGVVESYTHVCRARVNVGGKRDRSAPRCTYSIDVPDMAKRTCPAHGDKLWPKANVRATVHFHMLGHTTGSLLAQARVPAAAVAAAPGHSDVRLTFQRYAHLSPDYLRAEMEHLRFGVEAPQVEAPQAGEPVVQIVPLRAIGGGFEAPDRALVGRNPTAAKARADRLAANSAQRAAFGVERETGFEPATLSLGS